MTSESSVYLNDRNELNHTPTSTLNHEVVRRNSNFTNTVIQFAKDRCLPAIKKQSSGFHPRIKANATRQFQCTSSSPPLTHRKPCKFHSTQLNSSMNRHADSTETGRALEGSLTSVTWNYEARDHRQQPGVAGERCTCILWSTKVFQT